MGYYTTNTLKSMNPRVLVRVVGGTVQSVLASEPIDLEIFDEDALGKENDSRQDIGEMWKKVGEMYSYEVY